MDLKDKRILVTGGAGFIGSNLVESLIDQGCEVVVLDDFSSGKEANLANVRQSGKIHIVKGTVLDSLLVRKLVKEVDVIFHLAEQCLRACLDRPHHVHEVNATGTLYLLEAMRMVNQGRSSRRINKFVYCSSSQVYGSAQPGQKMCEDHQVDPAAVYGVSKLAGELYTQAYHSTWGLPTVVVRPFNAYGYRQHHEGSSGEAIPRFAVRIMNNLPPVVFGDGNQTRDFTFITDVVSGIIKAGCSDALIGQIVNIGSGQEVSVKEIAERLIALLGKPDMQIKYEPARPIDVLRQCCDSGKLAKVAGFVPEVNIDEGLKLYVSWLKSQDIPLEKLLAEMIDHNWQLDLADLASTRH